MMKAPTTPAEIRAAIEHLLKLIQQDSEVVAKFNGEYRDQAEYDRKISVEVLLNYVDRLIEMSKT